MPGLTLQDAQKRGFRPANSQPVQSSQNQENPILGVAKGVGKGVLSTLTGLGTLTSKGLSYLPGEAGKAFKGASQLGQDLQKNELSATTGAQKVGKGAEQIAEWFIPSGWFAKGAKAIEAGIGATKVGKLAGQGSKTAQFLTKGTQFGARSGVAATEGATISGVQSGGDTETVKENALFGAATPIVGKGLSFLGKGASKIASGTRNIATGVKGDVFQRLKQAPQAYDDALRHVEENQQQPFFQLANAVSSKLKERLKSASDTFAQKTDNLSQELNGKTFDYTDSWQKMADRIKSFRLKTPDMVAGKKGVENKPGIVSDVFTPLAKNQVSIINDLLKTVKSAKNVTLDDIRNIGEKFNTAYDQVPLGAGNKPTRFHAIVTGLKKEFDNITNEKVPQLKDINKEYSLIRNVYNKYSTQFIDENGNLKPGAEQFLSNIHNLNKGASQKQIAALEELTGIPILDNVQVLKDAQKLNNLFPATGSRTQDILRSLATVGAGTVAGGFGLGSAAGVAFSSPKLQAKLSIKAAELSKKFPDLPPQVKQILQYISGGKIEGELTNAEKNVSERVKNALDNPKAGLSIKDVSKSSKKYFQSGKPGYGLKGNGTTQPTSLIQEAKKYATPEEFVNEKNNLGEYLHRAQLSSDTAKTYNKSGSEYSVSGEKIRERMSNQAINYGKKQDNVNLAIDEAIKNGNDVWIGPGYQKSLPNYVPIVYFELPNGQVSFHMPGWGLEELRPGVLHTPEKNTITSGFIYENGFKYPKKFSIPEKYKNLWSDERQFSGDKNSREIIKIYNEKTKSQLTDIWKKANEKTKTVIDKGASKYFESKGKLKPGVLKVLSDFTDYAAGGIKDKKLGIQLEIQARAIAKKLGLKEDVNNKSLANKFGRILERNKFKK